MSYLAQPRGLSFQQWAGIITEQFAGPGVPQVVPDETEWREWGSRLQEVNTFALIPRPDGFSTWEEWADRVYDILSG